MNFDEGTCLICFGNRYLAMERGCRCSPFPLWSQPRVREAFKLSLAPPFRELADRFAKSLLDRKPVDGFIVNGCRVMTTSISRSGDDGTVVVEVNSCS